MSFPQVGQILPNGHTVDAAYCVGDARYVLAHRYEAPQQYVVWNVDQDGDTVNGRYFHDPVAAQKKFAECCFDWWSDIQKHWITPLMAVQQMDLSAYEGKSPEELYNMLSETEQDEIKHFHGPIHTTADKIKVRLQKKFASNRQDYEI